MRDTLLKKSPVRCKKHKYPDYTAEVEALDAGGITDELLRRIIRKHRYNAEYNKRLIERYEALAEGVPIFDREPRFSDGEDAINHKINNDFFSEIVDFKTGYFAGNPIGYSYSDTEESMKTPAKLATARVNRKQPATRQARQSRTL